MSRPVIQWDVDGVLADFDRGYKSLANRLLGTKLDVNTKVEFWDSVEWEIGKENDRKVWNHIKEDPRFWLDLQPLVTPAEIERISRLDCDQYFVTSRVGKWPKDQTLDWLLHNFPHLPSPTVIVSNRKADAANALKANYVIDDKAGNVVVMYYDSVPGRKVYVLDAPYNQFDTRVLASKVRRVKSVTEFLNDVELGA